MSTAPGAMPHAFWMSPRAATTSWRGMKHASKPTSATCVVPSSNTAARTFNGSCTVPSWNALP